MRGAGAPLAHTHAVEVETGWRGVSMQNRLLVMLAAFVVVGLATGFAGRWSYGPLMGWLAAALIFESWAWASIYSMDPGETASHATREDPSRPISEVLLLVANLASLAAVGYVIFDAANTHGLTRALLGGLALASVAISWVLVQTLFTLRYAALYYAGRPDGSTRGFGIEFNQEEPPQYTDFAYLAFTMGMTYQVSDTNLKTTPFRILVLRHGLLSYVFGSVILATTINLVVGLSTA
jgi:uncharacterized membrane protein